MPICRFRVRIGTSKQRPFAFQHRNKGVLILSGHLGNWEIAVVGGIGAFPQYRGQLHFLRRPVRPLWLERLVTRRFHRAGLGVIAKKGSLDEVLDRLAATDAVIFTFDQHAGGRDGILADFFGHPAWTFRSLAIISLSTGDVDDLAAPLVPRRYPGMPAPIRSTKLSQ